MKHNFALTSCFALQLTMCELNAMYGCTGLGISTGAGIKDDSVALKVLGCGITLGRKISMSFLDSEVGLDLGKAKQNAELALAAPRRQMSEHYASALIAASQTLTYNPRTTADHSHASSSWSTQQDDKFDAMRWIDINATT